MSSLPVSLVTGPYWKSPTSVSTRFTKVISLVLKSRFLSNLLKILIRVISFFIDIQYFTHSSIKVIDSALNHPLLFKMKSTIEPISSVISTKFLTVGSVKVVDAVSNHPLVFNLKVYIRAASVILDVLDLFAKQSIICLGFKLVMLFMKLRKYYRMFISSWYC